MCHKSVQISNLHVLYIHCEGFIIWDWSLEKFHLTISKTELSQGSSVTPALHKFQSKWVFHGTNKTDWSSQEQMLLIDCRCDVINHSGRTHLLLLLNEDTVFMQLICVVAAAAALSGRKWTDDTSRLLCEILGLLLLFVFASSASAGTKYSLIAL